MDAKVRALLEKQGYAVVGEGAAKTCHWLREKLLRGRPCYKERFFGIESHRCLQMTPVANVCNQRCLFCWRYQGADQDMAPADDPEALLDGLIEGQRRLVSGFGGDPRVDRRMWEEARNPNQVAISLSGEPTLYPLLGEFIRLCHRRGMTTFLVTNGTVPEALAELNPLPTQLYVSLDAPDEEVYRRLCVPKGKPRSMWAKVMETLDLLPSLDTRTVVRHTVVKGWNLDGAERWAKLDERADPTFIEPKGYVFVGYSRERMHVDNMPSQDEIRALAARLAELTGRRVLAEQPASRVALIGDSPADLPLPGRESAVLEALGTPRPDGRTGGD